MNIHPSFSSQAIPSNGSNFPPSKKTKNNRRLSGHPLSIKIEKEEKPRSRRQSFQLHLPKFSKSNAKAGVNKPQGSLTGRLVESPKRCVNIPLLPVELIERIFLYVNGPEVFSSLAKVCVYWNRVVRNSIDLLKLAVDARLLSKNDHLLAIKVCKDIIVANPTMDPRLKDEIETFDKQIILDACHSPVVRDELLTPIKLKYNDCFIIINNILQGNSLTLKGYGDLNCKDTPIIIQQMYETVCEAYASSILSKGHLLFIPFMIAKVLGWFSYRTVEQIARVYIELFENKKYKFIETIQLLEDVYYNLFVSLLESHKKSPSVNCLATLLIGFLLKHLSGDLKLKACQYFIDSFLAFTPVRSSIIEVDFIKNLSKNYSYYEKKITVTFCETIALYLSHETSDASARFLNENRNKITLLMKELMNLEHAVVRAYSTLVLLLMIDRFTISKKFNCKDTCIQLLRNDNIRELFCIHINFIYGYESDKQKRVEFWTTLVRAIYPLGPGLFAEITSRYIK